MSRPEGVQEDTGAGLHAPSRYHLAWTWLSALCLPRRVIEAPFGQVRVGIPEEAADNMLEESSRLRLHELGNHIAQYGANRIEPLVSGADVVEPVVIQ